MNTLITIYCVLSLISVIYLAYIIIYGILNEDKDYAWAVAGLIVMVLTAILYPLLAPFVLCKILINLKKNLKKA